MRLNVLKQYNFTQVDGSPDFSHGYWWDIHVWFYVGNEFIPRLLSNLNVLSLVLMNHKFY